MEEEIACCREERMKNGKDYRNSIRKQIEDLLAKAHLGNDQKAILKNLDSGREKFIKNDEKKHNFFV